jgi:membrane protease YdiL (CAAX protease family)
MIRGAQFAGQPEMGSSYEGGQYRRPAPIPALARFVLAVLWTAGVFWASGFVYTLFPGRNLLPGVIYRIVACLLTAGGFLFLLRVLDYNPSPWPRALALPFDGVGKRQFSTGLALGALLISADAAAIAGLGSLHFHLHLSLPMAARTAGTLVLLFFGALLEELSFRGYPFEKLIESCGAFWAVVILSALFGAVHLGNPDAGGWLSWGFFNTLIVGVLFALARIRSGSLWLSCGMHFGWNLFQGTVYGLPVSGLSEFSTLVAARVHGPLWLTGGDYGPEASAVCFVVLIAGFPLLWMLTASRKIQHRPVSSPGI